MFVKMSHIRRVQKYFVSKNPGNSEGFFLNRRQRFIDSEDVRSAPRVSREKLSNMEGKENKKAKIERLESIIENAGV